MKKLCQLPILALMMVFTTYAFSQKQHEEIPLSLESNSVNVDAEESGCVMYFNYLETTSSTGEIKVEVINGLPPYLWYKNGVAIAATNTPISYIQFGCSPDLLELIANTSCGQKSFSTFVTPSCFSANSSNTETIHVEEN